MDESRLRVRLEQTLRRPLREAEWRHLKRARVVEVYYSDEIMLGDSEASWKEFKKTAAEHLGWLQGFSEDQISEQSGELITEAKSFSSSGELERTADGALPDGRFGDRVPFSSYTRARGRAFSEWMAAKADRISDVVEFRTRVLQGRLTFQEADALLGSPAAALFPPEWFEDWKIPVAGHHVSHIAYHVEPYGTGPAGAEMDHRATLQIDPSGITKTVRYAHPDTYFGTEDRVDARAYVVRDGEEILPYHSTLPSSWKLSYLDQDFTRRRLYVWPGSVLDRLHQIGILLAEIFQWSTDRAAWFVLTGETPQMKPLDAYVLGARFDTGDVTGWGDWAKMSNIIVEAAPWVSAEEVKCAYRHVQQQALIVGTSKKMGSPKMGPRALEVYTFVREQERLKDFRPSFGELLALWNRRYPDKQFGSYNNLRQYFKRGERAVEGPSSKYLQEGD